MKKIKKQKAAIRQGLQVSLSRTPQGKKITKEMGISEILQEYPKAFEVFLKHNLPCVGCAAAHFENLEAIAREFNIDIDKLLKDLNKIAK